MKKLTLSRNLYSHVFTKYANFKISFISLFLIFSSLSNPVSAGIPDWTIEALTPTAISVPNNGTATVQYRVTNQGAQPHVLFMEPIKGITQNTANIGTCGNPFTLPAKGSSCVLSLQIQGSQIPPHVLGGPVVCEQKLRLHCYRPGSGSRLDVTVITNLYTVTPSGDGNVSMAPNTPQTVGYGLTRAFTVTANTGYTVSPTVDGTCPAGSWSGSTYTTGAITSDCSVSFSASINTYLVTPSGDGNMSMAPNTPQMVGYGLTQAFTVTANTGYTVSPTVGGTCPAGSWSGNTYTTGAITGDCSVSFSASINTYLVTPNGDGNVSMAPNTPQTVDYGLTQAFTVTANTGYTLSPTVSGTCPAGSWNGNTYTTGAITGDCSVSFSASINTYLVTPSGDGNVSTAPNTPQTVDYGSTQAFTVTANTGYTLSPTVSGTCPAGSWGGSTYTTGAITSDCSVSFSASINTYLVTPNGDGNVSMAPNTPQTVDYGLTQAFTVTANTGYTLSPTVSGTCPAGSWSGSTYTTGAITSDCTVSFNAVAFFPAAAGPVYLTAIPGNGQVTLSWVAPTNAGTGTITGYTVAYGLSSSSNYTTFGCSTSALSCTVNGLTNGTAYTFTVTTTTTLNGLSETGPAAFSSSVTPSSVLSASPETLAVSGLGGGARRSLQIINNSTNTITIESVSAPSPALPGAAVMVTWTANDCTNVSTLSAGSSCTITIDPGASATSTYDCTTGIVPTPSVITVTTSIGSVNANIILLGCACQYQGGYVFSIDDTAGCNSNTCSGSIGGTVAALQDQSTSTEWGALSQYIWGTGQGSNTTNPQPKNPNATLILGQLNCNGNLDGFCNSNNIVLVYPSESYAANLCYLAAIDSAGNSPCQVGNECYNDWYLPAVCEMGYQQSDSVLNSFCSLSPGIVSNMQYSLIDVPGSDVAGLETNPQHWSSTSYPFTLGCDAGSCAWYEYFTSSDINQDISVNNNLWAVRCVRGLTH